MPSLASQQTSEPVEAARRLIRDARFADAETEARRTLVDVEASSGADSMQAAAVLDVLVEALCRGGRARAPETRQLAERALVINEARLPASQADVARSLTTLGTVLRLLGDYAGAKSRLDRALAVQEQALPARDPAIANTLDAIGLVLERQGDNPGADRVHRQALDIREQALGASHPDVATSLNNLGNVQSNMGNYAEARTLHERALRIREQVLGAHHPDVAAALNNLAVDARDLGDHAAAWWLLERVLGIYEKTIGPTHPTVGLVHHNLATILLDLGDAEGPQLLAERARRINGRDPAARASLTPTLTVLIGGPPPPAPYAAAQALFERALMIKEAALGPDHPSVAVTLTTLANVLSHQKQWDRAAPLYDRALAIRERTLGPTHPDVAATLDRIGESLVEKGDDRAAKPVFERALAILENVYGPDHPHVGSARQHLSTLLARLDDRAAALRMALETERIGRDHLRAISATLPERDVLTYAAERPVGLDVALTLVTDDAHALPSSRDAVWDAVVRSRGIVLEHMARRHRRLRLREEADVTRLFDDLSSARDRLARLVMDGPGASPETYRASLDRAREARDVAERALAERSLTFEHEQFQRRIGLADIEAALPPESVLVAFVRYQRQPTRPSTAGGVRDTSVAHGDPSEAAYLAFVMRAAAAGGNPGGRGGPGEPSSSVAPGYPGVPRGLDEPGASNNDGAAPEPVLVPLGGAAAIDDAIARWRKQMTAVAFAGGRPTARAENALRRSGGQLRTLIWDPLAPHMANARRIFIVPDGPLHLVNWDALPASGGSYLVEHAPPFHYLSAERDLVRDAPSLQSHAPRESREPRGLLIVDSPIFDEAARPPALLTGAPAGRPHQAAAAPRAETVANRDTVTRPPAASGTRGPAACVDIRSMRFDPLPASAREAETIAAIWRTSHPTGAEGRFGVSRLSGRAATEAEFKRRAARASVLHLATHGFFLGGLCAPSPSPSAAGPTENPLLLAGFALTGANRRQTAAAGEEDGMLTAEEIASLDLSAVEWAVLSACDTGVGEIRAGEGVFGLRRAFHIAGARTVIMSLWPVDDEDALRWMTSVYDRRFRRGAETLEAVRASSLEQLRRRRKAGLSTHPFYWAAFIAAGDWR